MTEKTDQGSPKTHKKAIIKNSTKYALPSTRLSFEKQVDLIKAYVVVSKNGEMAVNYNSFKSLVDMHPTIISSNNEFFGSLGIIKEVEGKRGNYVPTEKAIKLCNAIKWNKQDEINQILQELISVTWFWRITKQLLDYKETITRDELRNKLGYEAEADPKRHSMSLGYIIDYLVYSGLLIDKEGSLMESKPVLKEANNLLPQNKDSSTTKSSVAPLLVLPQNNDQSSKISKPQLVMAVMINPEMSEEQIRDCVRIILDELKKQSA